MKTFNEEFNSQKTEAEILTVVSKAEEFDQLKVGESVVKYYALLGLSITKMASVGRSAMRSWRSWTSCSITACCLWQAAWRTAMAK